MRFSETGPELSYACISPPETGAVKIHLSPDLSPTSWLEVDSPAARQLTWLPYAVRFKLDACGLRMSLHDWQRLPAAQRMALVRAPLIQGPGGFQPLALATGASEDASGRAGPEGALEPADFRYLHEDVMEGWLAGATTFSKYVLRKIAAKKQVHGST
jgi:hypothetical protein